MSIKEIVKRFWPCSMKKAQDFGEKTLAEIESLRRQVTELQILLQRVPPVASSERLVVSMTTYPPRFGGVCTALRSLLQQTVRPEKIVVYLDVSESEITDEMRSLRDLGVEYRFGCENLKPHKKWFYALQEFRDCNVVTVDDDLVYPPTMLEWLCASHAKHPRCVIANRVHKIAFSADGKLQPYNLWNYECESDFGPSHRLFATHGAGALFPAHVFRDDAFNAPLIKRCCLNADDVYLKFMELENDVKVVWSGKHCGLPPFVEGSQNVGLCFANVGRCENDKYIENMLDFCGRDEMLAKLRGEA